MAHGRFNSKLWTTSGCKTPIIPICLPLAITSAQRPGKNISSKKEKKTIFICVGRVTAQEEKVLTLFESWLDWKHCESANSLRAIGNATHATWPGNSDVFLEIQDWDLLGYSRGLIGHFRIIFSLFFKASPGTHPFL